MGAGYLDTLAHDLLDAALDGLAVGRTGVATPTRVYVAHGEPAVDICTGEANGQLTVHAEPAGSVIHVGAPEAPRIPRTLLVQPVATFVIQVWRCHVAFTDDGNIPSADVLDDAASMLLTDLWCLLTQVYDEARDGTLFSVDCMRVTIGDTEALGPLGGAAGWAVPVTVALSDTGP